MQHVSNDIHILCGGGLGNKLPSLSGGIAVAEFYGKTNITIHWQRTPQCGAKFEELFSDNCAANFTLAPMPLHETMDTVWDEYKNILSTLPDSVLYGFEPNTHPLFINVRENHPRSLTNYKNRTIVYESNLPNFFIDPITQMNLFREYFQFKEGLVAEAAEFIAFHNISKKTLGVHMRIGGLGNWEDPKCKINVEKSIEQILSLRQNYENVFISTDDSSILPIMEKAIDKCFYRISAPHSVSETTQLCTLDQVQGAVIDLLILANTDLQIFSPYSTFALWAILLSNPIGDYAKFFTNGFMRPYWGY